MYSLDKKVRLDNDGVNMVDPGRRTLAPINEQSLDKEKLLEEYQNLIKYKLNAYKLEEIIKAEDDQDSLNEYQLMLEQLQETIQLTEAKIKEMQEKDIFFYSTDLILNENIQRLAKCYYQKDNKWYHAIIRDVDLDEQVAEVHFIGTKDFTKLPAYYIRLLPVPEIENYRPGYTCEAIYPEDGKFYPCEIEEVTAEGRYVIKYKKYNNKETVGLYFLRENKKIEQVGMKRKTFTDLTELKIPDNLKILPGDSEQEKEKKKKKVKALKQAFKQAQMEKDHKEKQDKWVNFKNQDNINKFQKNKKSIFTSPENIEGKVGVTNSGIGMTKIPDRIKLNNQDNSDED